MGIPQWPDREDDGTDEDQPRPEGFCPGCTQPRFDGVIIHQPHCPFGRDYYDNPDDSSYPY